MASPTLTQTEISHQLSTLPAWEIKGDTLSRTWTFTNFVEAMAFVNKVADAAESAQHHPDIDIRYNKVTMGLTTHDSGGITAKDFEMARLVDSF